MNPAIEPVLKELIDRHGLGLLEESGRLKSFLHDECPQSKREISVLMMALEERVPQDLMRVQSGEPLQSLAPRLAKRLADQKSLARAASDWAVRTWARGLGVAHGDAANDASNDGSLFVSAHDQSIKLDQPQPVTGNTPPAFEPRLQPQAAARVLPLRAKRILRLLLLFAIVAIAALVVLWTMPCAPLELSSVQMRESFVADGKKRDVVLAFKSRRGPAQSVQVKFLRGVGNWNPSTWTVPVTPEANAQGQVVVGSLSHRSLQPASMTFEYVLVLANGYRSAPYEKTFEIQPATVLPPTITKIDMPAQIYAGRSFTFTINYEAGNGDVAQIERKIVESTGTWVPVEATQPAVGTMGKKSGSVSYRLQAAPQPSRNTVEFALVDANGARSEAQRVSFEVLPAPAVAATTPTGAERSGVVVSVREVQGDANGLGAAAGGAAGALLCKQLGGNAAAALGCGAAAAIAGHELEKRMKTAYDITVRFDDGGTQVIRDTTSRRRGDRVRVANGAIVSAG